MLAANEVLDRMQDDIQEAWMYATQITEGFGHKHEARQIQRAIIAIHDKQRLALSLVSALEANLKAAEHAVTNLLSTANVCVMCGREINGCARTTLPARGPIGASDQTLIQPNSAPAATAPQGYEDITHGASK